MFVPCFELLGWCFTNFHYYYHFHKGCWWIRLRVSLPSAFIYQGLIPLYWFIKLPQFFISPETSSHSISNPETELVMVGMGRRWGGGGGGEELVPKLKFGPITSWSQADCFNHCHTYLPGYPDAWPGKKGARCQWLMTCVALPTADQSTCLLFHHLSGCDRSWNDQHWENTIIIYTKLREYNNYIQCHSCCFIIWQGFNCSK